MAEVIGVKLAVEIRLDIRHKLQARPTGIPTLPTSLIRKKGDPTTVRTALTSSGLIGSVGFPVR